MTKSFLNKLLLARRLYNLACENLRSTNDLSLSVGVNLLQDSVEAFLLAGAEHVNAQVQAKTAFEQYFDLIDAKIAPKTLPFRTRLVALNKLRVNSKHYGLAPAQSEVGGLVIAVREFFDEVASSVLGLSFATISLVDLLSNGEAKDLLKEAETAFLSGAYEESLFFCRKAIFVRIECDYDVSPFERGNDLSLRGIGILGRKSPHFARTKDYIEKNVGNATDYIVLDHSTIDIDLLKKGIDTVSFWNVWRLTPEVYREKKGSAWVQKRDFSKLEQEGVRERAEYVLDTVINMLVSADLNAAASRWTEPRRYFIDLKREGVPLFEKASLASVVTREVPSGIRKVYVDFSVEAIKGEGLFWHVSHYEEGCSLSGYVSGEEVEV